MVFEIEIDDEGEDSGSKRADRTASSFVVRVDSLDCTIVAVAVRAIKQIQVHDCVRTLNIGLCSC